MPMGIGLGIGVTRGGGVGWWPLGSELAFEFDNGRGFNSIDRTKTTPDSILTYTNPSAKMVYGSDGVLRYAPHNLLTFSEQFDNAAWGKAQATVTENSTSTVAPDGTTTADALLDTATNNIHYIAHSISGLSPAGRTFTVSAYLKKSTLDYATVGIADVSTGSLYAVAVFNLNTGAVATSGAAGTGYSVVSSPPPTSVGNGWYRCVVTAVAGTSVTFLRAVVGLSKNGVISAGAAGFESYLGNGSGFFVWGAQCAFGSSALTYIPTTTAAVYSLPIDHNPTTFEPLGVLIEEQRTNLCLYSDDFTNAAWVKTNLTAAKTATGPDGVTNSASTITASASNGVALQAITSASAARSGSVYLKRRTGTGAVTIAIGETTGSELVVNGTFATDVTGWTDEAGSASAAVSGAINVTTTTANTWTYQAIAVTAGKIYRVSFDWTQKQGGGRFLVGTSIGGTALANATSVGSGQVFYFVATAATIYISLGDLDTGSGTVNIYDNISLFEVAETTIDLSLGGWVRGSIVNKTITNPCFAIKLATSGDAVDVDIAGIENGAFITSPIPTVASQVTRLADQVSILTSAFGYNATAGTIATEYYDSGINSALWRIDDGGDNYYFRAIRDTGSMVASAVYGGVGYPVYLTATAKGMPTKFAAGWDAASINAAINGTLGTANTSLTLPTVLIFRIGNNRNAQYYNSHIKRLTYFPTRRTDADLQVLST